MRRTASTVVLFVILVLSAATTARAQSLGVFRWQLQPYCNVVTLNVELKGSAYVLTGFDDQCGSSARAAVSGTAFVNAGGAIGLGFTIVSPSGGASHVSATVTLSTVSGTWRDSIGNSGTFIYGPVVGGGPPRPVDTGWREIGAAGQPAFRSGWQNGTPPYICSVQNPGCPTYQTAAFRKDAQGVVHLKGSLSWTVASGVIFELPEGYRPGAAVAFPVQGTLPGCPSYVCRIVIYDRFVQLSYSAGITPMTYYFSLDGISFLAEQ